MIRILRSIYIGGLIAFMIFAFYGIAIRYFQPTLDGDIYFHLAYGKQIVKTHSLHIDEEQFRWSGYDKNGVGLYPAWIPDVIFYLLYKLGNNSLYFLYSLRVMMLFVFLMVIVSFMYKWKIRPSFLIVTMSFALYMLIRNGMMFKADMFSVLFYFLLVSCYFAFKSFQNEKFLYFIPVVMLLWANSHVGVVMGVVFLGCIFLIEAVSCIVNRGKSNKIGKRFFRFCLILILSVLALFCTPKPFYYYNFGKSKFSHIAVNRFVKNAPVKGLFKYVMAFKPLNVNWNSIYFVSWFFLNCLFVLLLLGFGVRVFVKYRSYKEVIKFIPWWVVVLPLPFVKISFDFARFLHYFAIPVYLGSLFLISKMPIRLGWRALLRKRPRFIYYTMLAVESSALLLFLHLFDLNIVVAEKTYVGDGSWVPVVETNYLIKHISGRHNLLTTYGVGSYILWKGYPKFKVYIDTRASDNFMDYIYLLSHKYRKMKRKPDEILGQCDIAVISFRHWPLLRLLLHDSSWKPITFGPSSAVFIKSKIFPDMKFSEPDWREFKEQLIAPYYPENLIRFLLYLGKIDSVKRFLKVAKVCIPGWYNFTKEHWDFILKAEQSKTDQQALESYLGGLMYIEKMPFPIQQVILCLARKRVERLFHRQDYKQLLEWEFLIFRFARHRETCLYNKALCFYKMGRITIAKTYFSAFLKVIDSLKIKEDDWERVEKYVNVSRALVNGEQLNEEELELMGI